MPSENAPELPNRPIRPEEVTKVQVEQFPPEVFQVFNALIAENISNGDALVFQEDAVKRMVACGLRRALIFQKGWLNVEDAYREAGWKVEYDKPGYNESYPASFRFKSARKHG